MQISGFPVVIPASSPNQRVDIAERVQKDVQRDDSRSREQGRNERSLEELRLRDEAVEQQRIAAGDRANRINNYRQQGEEQLPLSTQRALQAFANNSPSAEQQLGIELVGVDTFA